MVFKIDKKVKVKPRIIRIKENILCKVKKNAVKADMEKDVFTERRSMTQIGLHVSSALN